MTLRIADCRLRDSFMYVRFIDLRSERCRWALHGTRRLTRVRGTALLSEAGAVGNDGRPAGRRPSACLRQASAAPVGSPGRYDCNRELTDGFTLRFSRLLFQTNRRRCRRRCCADLRNNIVAASAWKPFDVFAACRRQLTRHAACGTGNHSGG